MLWMFSLALQQSYRCIQAGEQLWSTQMIIVLDQLFILVLLPSLGCLTSTTCCLPSGGFQSVGAASPLLQPCQAVPCATNSSANTQVPALTQHLAQLQTWHHPGESSSTLAAPAPTPLHPCPSESTTAIPTLTSIFLVSVSCPLSL